MKHLKKLTLHSVVLADGNNETKADKESQSLKDTSAWSLSDWLAAVVILGGLLSGKAV